MDYLFAGLNIFGIAILRVCSLEISKMSRLLATVLEKYRERYIAGERDPLTIIFPDVLYFKSFDSDL